MASTTWPTTRTTGGDNGVYWTYDETAQIYYKKWRKSYVGWYKDSDVTMRRVRWTCRAITDATIFERGWYSEAYQEEWTWEYVTEDGS